MTSAPSVYAVSATKTEDVVGVVNFALEQNFRLVVKGGSFSKNYGPAAAALLEAEVVTADGAMRIANACHFWIKMPVED